MGRASVREKERSSRKSRDNDRDRELSERDRDRDRDRDQDGDERRHRDRDRDRDGEERRHHRHRDNDDRRYRDDEDKRRHSSKADSVERDLEPRRERFSDRDRVRDSVERGQSVERRHHSSSSRKRKEHDDDGDLEEDRKRAKEERRERRRFEDRASEENGEGRDEKGVKEEVISDGDEQRKRREGRRFSDSGRVDKEDLDGERAAERRRLKGSVKEEDELDGEQLVNGDHSNGDVEESSSRANVAQGLLGVTSEVSVTSAAFHHPPPRQVSSITTTNENEGISIIRSDEVTGNSSTDGTTTSVARTSGGLSLDALAKAKKALQARKEMTAKLSKLASVQSDKNLQAASNADGQKVPTSGVVGSRGSSMSTTSVQATSSLANSAVGSATSEKASSTVGMGVIPGFNSIPNIEAVKRAQELAAKMGFHQDPEFAPLINMFPGPPAVADVAVPQRPSKAPVLRLDAQGREIDEHGNVINMPKLTNLSTLKVNINKQKKEAFQILKPELDADTQSNPHFDASMGINKTKLLRPKRMTFQFVEEGKWSKQAEYIKIKNQFGEAQSKELKVKESQLAKAKAEPDDNPNLIVVPERVFRDKKKDEIPEIEWWDKPILPSGAYGDAIEEKLNMEKITIYIEHPRPIDPPAEPAPPPPQPLKLTKKEQKKLRTQRRVAKERDRQEMVRQGLLEPPKPKIKMSNLMKVLGSEATQDPTRLEMEIRSAAAEREQAHVDRNIARKLTPAERREKKERKLFEDPNTLETIVSVYRINNLSHPQTRFKVDVNAHENRLTGCAVISDGISVVAVEGGKKSIKRYGKLMLKRINWAAAVGNDESDAEKLDAPVNSCALVWQGSVAKRSFNKFYIHQCRSEAAARKVFADAGVPQYWDLAANFSDELQ